MPEEKVVTRMKEEKAFTPHAVMALLEEVNQGVKVIGEQGKQNTKDIAEMKEQLKALPDMKADLRLLMMDMRDVKIDIRDMQQELSQKADKKEVQAVSSRVTMLEKHFVPA